MISIAGAQTLATVIPVGLLVLAFQAREEDRLVGGTPFANRLVRWCRIALMVTVIASVFAEFACVTAVASGAALRGVSAAFVYVVGYALADCVTLVIVVAVLNRSGLMKDIDAWRRRDNTRDED